MINPLKQSISGYKKDSFFSGFFVMLEVLMEVLIPFLMASFIDNGVVRGDRKYILSLGAVLACIALISLTFGSMSAVYAARASAGVAKNLRKNIFDRVQSFSIPLIEKFSVSSLVTRMTTDVTNVQNAYQIFIRMAVRAVSMLAFAIVMAFSVNSTLAWVYVIFIPVLSIGLLFIIRSAYPVFQKVFRKYDRLNTIVQENLYGIRVVKSFVREKHEQDKFASVSEEIYRNYTYAEKILAFNMPLMQFCVYGCMLIIALLGAFFIVESKLTTGELMSMMVYTMQILMSLMMLSMVFVMMVISRASLERISEVLQSRDEMYISPNPVYEIENGEIVFEHVSFRYAKDAREVLKDLSFTIKSGETIGILGGTGSGKTTLVSLIVRLYDVTDGRILLSGHDIKEYDQQALHKQIGYVMQKSELFSGTVRQNLMWADENAGDEDIQKVCRLAEAEEFIEKMPERYETRIEQDATNISGGQKQRLCIARALLKKSSIYIFDDAMSAVDTKTDRSIRTALYESCPDATKIFIAQRISTIMDADRIFVMDKGEISDIGTHEQLLERCPIYRQTYLSQQKGGCADEK